MSKETMHPELKKMWEDYFDKCFAAFAKEHEKAFKELQQEQGEHLAMQVRPSEFAELIKGKETVAGIPAYWAEWPNKEKP
jgi:wobble nucleotide-excising tRNase